MRLSPWARRIERSVAADAVGGPDRRMSGLRYEAGAVLDPLRSFTAAHRLGTPTRTEFPVAETISLVCGHVFRNERRVRLVIHHDDGGWQFVCGERDHPGDCSDFEPVGLEHLVERQPELVALLQTRRGAVVEQARSGRWNVSDLDGDD